MQREKTMLNSPDIQPVESPDEGPLTLRTLFESEESPLLRLAFSITGRRAVAEEIVQEVFLQLHANGSEVREPRAWLFRCVRNRSLSYLRRAQRESSTSTTGETSSEPESNEILPDEWVARMETVAELRQLVSELSDKDRRLIELKYFEDLKYRDISQRTGLTVSNVGFRLHQILKKLAVGLMPGGLESE